LLVVAVVATAAVLQEVEAAEEPALGVMRVLLLVLVHSLL
jgi:hypothetical protein